MNRLSHQVRLLLCALGTVFAFGSIALAEAPAIKGLVPAGVRSSETATVAIIGKSGSEPLETWCSRDDIVLSPTDKPSEWTVTAAADAPAGLRWVRFYNAEGATKLHPIVVGLLPETTEAESNDDVSAAHEIASLPTTVNGQLSQRGDVDTFAVNLEAGQTLIASVDAHRLLGSPMDGVLQLLSPRGFVLEQNDDHHGNDPRIVFVANQSGTYFVRMFAFPADPNSTIGFSSSDTYVYRLTLTTGPFVNHVVPLALSTTAAAPPVARGWNVEGNESSFIAFDKDRTSAVSLAVPTSLVVERLPRLDGPALLEDGLAASSDGAPLSIPVSVTGCIAIADETDTYSFIGRKDQSVVIAAEGQAFDSPLDPYLKVFGPDGKLLKEADDESKTDNDARIALTLPLDGTYRAEVRDRFGHGGEWSVYLLSLQEDQPQPELTLPDDPLVLEAGQSLDVEVTVNRRGGFDQELTVRMLGLPTGVSVVEARSPGTGDAAKKVTLKIEAEPQARFSGPVRVIGTTEEGTSVLATTTAPVAGLRVESLWLSVIAPKE